METTMKSNRYFKDIGVMTGRCMAHAFRSMDTIIKIIVMPIIFMLLFVYVFGGAIRLGTQNGSYIDYMLPGILLMSISTGIAYAAVRLNEDVTKGIFERFHSMPIAKSSILWGHVLTSVASCFISLAVIILFAQLLGFRPTAGIGAWLGISGILLMFTLATTWLAILSGLAAKSVEGASVFSYPLIYLPFLSSTFVPTESMPAALRAFAENQPVTAIVEAVRSLLKNEPAGSSILLALLWCVAIMIVAFYFAMRAYRRRVS